MEITCTQPGEGGASRTRISPNATAEMPDRIRLEIEGAGRYACARLSGTELLRAVLSALAEAGLRPAVPTATLDAALEAAWAMAEEQHACFNPFGSCPKCRCSLWPVDEWQPTGDRRCENCGHVVADDPGDCDPACPWWDEPECPSPCPAREQGGNAGGDRWDP